MTAEFLLDALGLLDDELIQDAEAPPAPSVFPWRRLTAWAACLALVLALGYGAAHLGMGSSSSGSANAGGGSPSASPGGGQWSGGGSSAPGQQDAWGDGSPSLEDEVLLVLVPVDGREYAYYHWYGEDRTVEVLPEGCRSVGKVARWSEGSAAPYTDYDKYLGSELWLLGPGAEGPLYLELPEGGYLECIRS